jgi:hypothetical protein
MLLVSEWCTISAGKVLAIEIRRRLELLLTVSRAL